MRTQTSSSLSSARCHLTLTSHNKGNTRARGLPLAHTQHVREKDPFGDLDLGPELGVIGDAGRNVLLVVAVELLSEAGAGLVIGSLVSPGVAGVQDVGVDVAKSLRELQCRGRDGVGIRGSIRFGCNVLLSSCNDECKHAGRPASLKKV